MIFHSYVSLPEGINNHPSNPQQPSHSLLSIPHGNSGLCLRICTNCSGAVEGGARFRSSLGTAYANGGAGNPQETIGFTRWRSALHYCCLSLRQRGTSG